MMNTISKIKNIQLIVFDLDNTLYDELLYFNQAFSEISKYISLEFRLSYDEVSNKLKELISIKGRSYHYLFNELLDYYGISIEKHLSKLLDIYCSFSPKLELYPGVLPLIKELGKAYKLGIITGGMMKAQKNKINSLDISKYFEHVLITQEIGANKPDSFPYSYLLNILKIKPDRSVYIGDNPFVDFIGAKTIGMPTIRVRVPEFSSVEVRSDFEADLVIDNILEIEKLFL